jgi:Ca2+/Na+ antiporter
LPNLTALALRIAPSQDLEAYGAGRGEEESEDADEPEEVPDDLKDLTPAEQQARIKWRAFYMMFIGSIILIVISDPVVNVLDEIGKRTGVPSFYIAFVFAPMASNASELVAAYNYAQKKTRATISISLATLLGAAIMNNTFVLGVFMMLVATQGLSWEFFAETLSILLVQFAMTFFALKNKHTLMDGLLILSLYPLSLACVYTLQAYGWD